MFREEGARQILLFPEGTNLSQSSAKKSDEYAVKNNLNKYNHVLHPRTSGLYSVQCILVVLENIRSVLYSIECTSFTSMFCILELQVLLQCIVYYFYNHVLHPRASGLYSVF